MDKDDAVLKLLDEATAISCVVLLERLMEASEPYLKRKKMTPRSQCKRLNEVHNQCRRFVSVFDAQLKEQTK